MTARSRFFLTLALVALVGALAPFALQPAAQAGNDGAVAYVAGAESTKKGAIELILFNTTANPMSLDLVLRGADGVELINRADEIQLGGRQTAVVSLDEQLSRDLARKEQPYRGILGVEICGDAPFGPDTVIVHVTQYFGKRKKPKGAVVLRPLFELLGP